MSEHRRAADTIAILESAMKIGIAVPSGFPAETHSPVTGPQVLRELVQRSFGMLEIGLTDDVHYQRRVRDLRDETGIVVHVDAGELLYRSGADPASADAVSRRRAVDIVCAAVDQARNCGGAVVSIISGPDPAPGARRTAISRLVGSVLDIYDYVGPAGDVAVALKMADREVHKKFLIGPTADGAEVATQVRQHHPDFGLVLNLGHLPLLSEDIDTAVETAAPYLTRADIGNCVLRDPASPLFGDHHPRIELPDSEIGVLELARFLRALLAAGYLGSERGIVCFEVRAQPNEDPWAVVDDGRRSLAAAWDAVRGSA